jgi:intracellular sulfur oxidation DsrE/DsrF family protein
MTDSLPRRSFLSRLAAGAAAASAAIGLPRLAGAQTATQRETHELDKWIDELKGQHKQIYDCVTKARIGDMMFARNFVVANRTDYGLKDDDISSIVSLRHEATAFAFNDAMWEKYKIGEVLDIPQRMLGGRGGNAGPPPVADTTRVTPDSTAAAAVPKATRNPQMSAITSMGAMGVQFTVCALALRAVSGTYARKLGLQSEDVRADLLANLVPKCRPVPAGVVIVNRAQEKGFTYLYIG